ncbi:TetR/AcrR family transcriptional regulator [Micromonospora endolithica]|uniref:TetR/AcrR family transcriptional regulator n=1 Tax=Micromonospora endolithica TaxID=230091 RepID=UPI0011ADAF66|nr:TetR/AcrR family transcriptional regulator [Micromonospora endolithica]TWJ22968.1 TetR family transcriptional regulator [Micromonospora endolithica]
MAEDWRDTLETHKARYRERIIDAAIELVAEEGVAKASMAALAQRAGIGRATVYKYFPDVEHALLAHVEREVDDCHAALRAVHVREEDPVARLRGCIEALLAYFASQRHRLSWVTLEQADLSSAAVSRLRTLMTNLPQPFIETIATGIDTGGLRGDLRPEVHGLLIFKMVVSLHDHLVAGALTQQDAVTAVWQLISEGVLPRENGHLPTVASVSSA